MWLEATAGSVGMKGDRMKKVWGREWLRVGWRQDLKGSGNMMLIMGQTQARVGLHRVGSGQQIQLDGSNPLG